MNRKHLLSMVAAVGSMAGANARAADDSGFYFGTGMGEVTNEANAAAQSERQPQARALVYRARHQRAIVSYPAHFG